MLRYNGRSGVAVLKKMTFLFVPIAVFIIFALLSVLGALQPIELSVYNAMLRFRPEPKELATIRLMDFDDQAIEEAGSWPVARNIYGDGLILLRELGAKYAVFDIEYVDEAPRGVNTEFLQDELPDAFKESFGNLGGDIEALFGAVAGGRIPAREAAPYVQDLVARTQSEREKLFDRVKLVAANNDEYLGRCARFFGKSFFTINMRNEPVPGIPDSARATAADVAAVKASIAPNARLREAKDIFPTIEPILSRASGAGFPNVYIDPDGVRRRIDLLYRHGDRVYAQLVLAPLLDMLGSPHIVVERNFVNILGARMADGTSSDIRIPRGEDGRMLIDWPHKSFLESFKPHISFKELMVHKRLYSDLLHNLRIREDWGYLSLYDGSVPLLAQAKAIEEYLRSTLEAAALDSIPEAAPAEYRKLRDAFLAELGRYLASSPDKVISAEMERVLADKSLDASTRAEYERIKDDAPLYFANTRTIVADLVDLRTRLAKELDGAFCILGQTGTSTTDIGVNPFDGQYMNVGTHASVLNTIVQRAYIDEAPVWVSVLITFASVFGLTFVIRKRKPLHGVIIGAGWTIVLAAIGVLAFATAGIELGIVPPVFATFSAFLASTLVTLLRTEKEKGFLRNAFSHYLSGEVIRSIIENPESLKLGGQKKHMTALFTDIRGFSTISEKMDPVDLVKLLNEYLTAMSETILDLQGTIDKYEGDAIMAFFNAPIDLEDHAYRACLAAIKMKRTERELNVQFLSRGLSPSEIMTRIGINSGEMVVGNMGTLRKMDYTIMGDAVNLAARLEGVNKQYGTWICVSEDTKNLAGPSIVFRQLDRIRVVGKSQPIRIFEIVEEKGSVDSVVEKTIEAFLEGIDRFERKDWQGALERFECALSIKADDGPSKTYRERCLSYIKNPPPENWDGVFNLTSK